jgi:uncharacterized damage-inducible protein DinB
MTHPLVEQLRFTRGELQRALSGVNDEEARRRFLPMNCISWIVGHLAWQEQRYWLRFAQGTKLRPELDADFAYGRPASAPPLEQVLQAWREVTAASDPWLDGVATPTWTEPFTVPGWGITTTYGSLMLRVIYHYYYHIGEIMAIRQLLGHTDLPEFIGDLDHKAPYRPEKGLLHVSEPPARSA